MKKNTEIRKSELEKAKSFKMQETEPEEEEKGDDKVWDLQRQLKSRMEALHGNKSRGVIARRKANYKSQNDLSDADTTPSDFDPDNSEYDDDSDDSDDDSASDWVMNSQVIQYTCAILLIHLRLIRNI